MRYRLMVVCNLSDNHVLVPFWSGMWFSGPMEILNTYSADTEPADSVGYKDTYHQTSNISHTLVGNKTVDHSDVVRASAFGAAPTTSSF